jgi:UDP-N-acetylglucosamine--N-acetylmuramyl-(pentapeptide) pyrophosphoryl-undecaprenol N-acetylglucosamine transferase
VILAAGGTGGHLFPAQALAEEFLARGRPLVLITDRRGDAFTGALGKIECFAVRTGTPTGRSLWGRLDGFKEIALGTLHAGRILRRLKAGAAVGFGGYPSLPTMLAAMRAGLPSVIHEQNAVLGRANRLLARRATAIAISMADTKGLDNRAHRKMRRTGNPVRSAIVAARETAYVPPGPRGPIRLLVYGGSQGARAIGEVVPAALAMLGETARARFEVTQQCRPEDVATVQAVYDAAGIRAETGGFFDDMPRRLAAAHLVIARAGASTVGELAVIGRPAILVPLPSAADDHQSENARFLAVTGGAWVMSEDEFTPDALARQVERLAANPIELAEAAAFARATGRADAARRLADMVDELVEKRAAFLAQVDARKRGR